jgi:hypothetical protein
LSCSFVIVSLYHPQFGKEEVLKYYKLIVAIASARVMSQMIFVITMPSVTSLVFSTTTTARTRGMELIRGIDSSITSALRYASTRAGKLQKLMQKCLDDVAFHKLQIVNEAFQVCRNSGWDHAGTEIRTISWQLHSGPPSTKSTLEDVFNHLQHVAARQQKGRSEMGDASKAFYANAAPSLQEASTGLGLCHATLDDFISSFASNKDRAKSASVLRSVDKETLLAGIDCKALKQKKKWKSAGPNSNQVSACATAYLLNDAPGFAHIDQAWACHCLIG